MTATTVILCCGLGLVLVGGRRAAARLHRRERPSAGSRSWNDPAGPGGGDAQQGPGATGTGARAGARVGASRPVTRRRAPAGVLHSRLLAHRIRTTGREELERWPAVVQQMSALLGSGTEPAAMWCALERQLLREAEDLSVRAPEAHGGLLGLRWARGVLLELVPACTGPSAATPRTPSAGSSSAPGRLRGGGPDGRGDPGGSGSAGLGVVAADVLELVRAARAGTALGLPTGATLRGTWLVHPRSRAVRDSLAAAWEVVVRTGAPLSGVLQRLASAVEDDLDALAARETALAGPRSTARILSSLPLLGLGLGVLMGTDPLGVLLGMGWGRLALLLGVLLSAAGVLWTRRLVHHAEEASP